MTMAMRGEKSAAIFPKPRPDLLAVRLWNFERINFGPGKKLESSLTARVREFCEFFTDFKQEHQPVRLALKTVLAHHAGQMQIRRRKRHANLLLRLPAGADVRRFADVHLEFSAAGTPKTAVRFLGTLEQEDLVTLVEAVEQCGDFIG